MPEKTVSEFVKNVLPYAGFAIFWQIAYLLHQSRSWKPFTLTIFIVNVILSAFVWIIVFTFLPELMSITTKVWIVWVSGFLSKWILDMLENKGIDLFIKKFLWNK